MKGAPTRFGAVSFAVASSGDAVEARIEGPPGEPRSEGASPREPLRAIVLRLPRKDAKPIRAVEVDGRPHAEVHAAAGLVWLVPRAGTVAVRVSY